MKHLLFILTAIVLLTGCSKNNNNDPQPKLTPQNATIADITGKWLNQADTTYQIVDGKAQVVNTEQAPFPENGSISYLQFNADGTCSSGNASGAAYFNYTLSNGIIRSQETDNDSSQGLEDDVTIIGITKSSLLLQTATGGGEYSHIYLTK